MEIGTQHPEIQDVFNTARSLGGSAGPVKAGRINVGRNTVLNGAMVVTLDKVMLARMVDRFADYKNIPTAGRYIFNRLQPVMLQIMETHYVKEETPGGKKWQELTPATERWRKWVGKESSPILQGETGDLLSDLRAAMNDTGKWTPGIVGGNPRLVIDASEIARTPKNEIKFYAHNLGIVGEGFFNNGWRLTPRPFFLNDMSELTGSDRNKANKAAKDGFDDYFKTLLHPDRARKRLTKGR